MIYDALSYLKECQEIAGEHKEAGDKATAEEFLSGLHKGDRLHPIITIVLYYDEKPWDGAQSLKDMIGDMPSEVSGVFSNYRMLNCLLHMHRSLILYPPVRSLVRSSSVKTV